MGTTLTLCERSRGWITTNSGLSRVEARGGVLRHWRKTLLLGIRWPIGFELHAVYRINGTPLQCRCFTVSEPMPENGGFYGLVPWQLSRRQRGLVEVCNLGRPAV